MSIRYALRYYLNETFNYIWRRTLRSVARGYVTMHAFAIACTLDVFLINHACVSRACFKGHVWL